MKEIKAIIQPVKLDRVMDALFFFAALMALPLDVIFLTSGMKGLQSIPLACLVSGATVWWFRKPVDGVMHPPQLPKDRPKEPVRGNRQTRRAKECAKERAFNERRP